MALSVKFRLGRAKYGVISVLRKGKTASNDLAVMRYMRRDHGQPSRFAFVVSRSVSRKSNKRALLRRRASEWIRKHAGSIAVGYDVVFIFKQGSAEATRQGFYSGLEALLKKTPLL